MSRTDLDAVFADLMDLSRYLLEKNGILAPVACARTGDGAIEQIGFDPKRECASEEVVRILASILREKVEDGTYVATAIAMDTSLVEPIDGATSAVAIELEDATECMVAVIPYRFSGDRLELLEARFELSARRVYS